ncbi:hypothetical protein ACFQL7_07810 [Halocatena marina]|uniref:Secreted protein n=1 Tax=Halocatena marina TaxID=2934937 RepID=A0ABD5YQ93_9EURY
MDAESNGVVAVIVGVLLLQAGAFGIVGAEIDGTAVAQQGDNGSLTQTAAPNESENGTPRSRERPLSRPHQLRRHLHRIRVHQLRRHLHRIQDHQLRRHLHRIRSQERTVMLLKLLRLIRICRLVSRAP